MEFRAGLEPLAAQVVDPEEEGGDGPGNGIACHHHRDRVVSGNGGKKPDDPEQAHAQHRNEHGDEAPARTPDRTAQDFDRNVGDPEGGQEAQHGRSLGNDGSIRREHEEQAVHPDVEAAAHRQRKDKGHRKALPHALPDPGVFPRPVILAGKSRDCNAHRVYNHPED